MHGNDYRKTKEIFLGNYGKPVKTWPHDPVHMNAVKKGDCPLLCFYVEKDDTQYILCQV